MTLAEKKRKGGKIARYVVVLWQGRRIWERAPNDRREAERLDRRRVAEVKAGTYQPPGRRQQAAGTVGDYLGTWADARKTRNADDDAKMLKRHVISRGWFASIPLTALAPRDVKRLVEELQDARRESGAPLADKTVSNLYGLVRTAMGAALFDEVIDRNPCLLPRGTIKRRPTDEKQVYTAGEIGALITGQDQPAHALFVALCLLTGMREGEVCGLRWRDYDAGSRPLGAFSLVQQYDGQPLKTDRRRVVPVHPLLAGMLELWRARGFELTHLRPPRPDDPILPRQGIAHHTKSSAYKLWRRCCTAAGVDNKSLHSTRHTFITLLRRAGIPKERIEPITHNASGTIIDRYTHWEWEPLCEVVLALVVDVVVDAEALVLAKLVEAPGIEAGCRHRNQRESTGT